MSITNIFFSPMLLATSQNYTLDIILVLIVIGIIIFTTVTSIINKKNRIKEKDKRKREVREKIKSFIRETDHKKNLLIEFEKIVARKGKEYKNRDIFEVIINIKDPKTNKHIEDRAYEIEGISIPIDKKNYSYDWVINSRLDLDHTRKRINILEGKIKLTKTELKNNKIKNKQNKKQKYLDAKSENKAKLKTKKTKPKENYKPNLDGNKFIPQRKKK